MDVKNHVQNDINYIIVRLEMNINSLNISRLLTRINKLLLNKQKILLYIRITSSLYKSNKDKLFKSIQQYLLYIKKVQAKYHLKYSIKYIYDYT